MAYLNRRRRDQATPEGRDSGRTKEIKVAKLIWLEDEYDAPEGAEWLGHCMEANGGWPDPALTEALNSHEWLFAVRINNPYASGPMNGFFTVPPGTEIPVPSADGKRRFPTKHGVV